MKKARKTSRRQNKKVTYLLLALAMILLLGSAIGSTRAALIESTEYFADIEVPVIGVSLCENGKVVSNRVNDETVQSDPLLENMLLTQDGKEEKLVLNKKYEEHLTVRNSGTIDEYVRVRIYKYWMKDGRKVTALSPNLIDLNLVNVGKPGEGKPWVMREPEAGSSNGVKECTELYYVGVLNPERGEAKITENRTNPKTVTEEFADTIRIDGKVADEVKVEQKGNIITTTYKYDGVEFHVDVEVDAVQTHNARDAIKSAWGVDADALKIL